MSILGPCPFLLCPRNFIKTLILMFFISYNIPAQARNLFIKNLYSIKRAWVEDLNERVKFITKWYEKGVPSAFWISGFYFPQAFLTGILQNFARKYIVSVDTVNFKFEVLNLKPREKPSDGCVVYGLVLEGCRWNGRHLVESLPKELYSDMQPIYLLPEVNHEIPENGIYICPVYKTVSRAGVLSTTGHSTNFVIAMEIPTIKLQEHWIKRGVALFCALNY